jgi:tetratricopeptide (TPR) repeat protein
VELQIHPQYRQKRGLDTILRKVPAGFDDFLTEKDAEQIEGIFKNWSSSLRQAPQDVSALEKVMSADFLGVSLNPDQLKLVNDSSYLKVWQVPSRQQPDLSREAFLSELGSALSPFSKLEAAEFQVVGIHSDPFPSVGAAAGRTLICDLRFTFVGTGTGFHLEQRVGHWQLDWRLSPSGDLRLQRWKALDEERCRASLPVFQDITSPMFGANPSYHAQFLPGTDYWRTVLDGACGIDIYGHNGVSVGDLDGDGLDDLYICQPSGLPNRLFRNLGGGVFEDITESSGVGVLENTACALFADVNNVGRQDLIVVRTTGPLLFVNEGHGKFRLRPGAFEFASPPQGTFTGAAIADYDRDGWLDIYFCLYAYYQGTDQYRYPMPYIEAENGPPNFMMRNNRDGTFQDITKQSGLDQNNTRYSFCCSWGDYNGDLWPDLYVVNDFGRKNLYRNNGDGTFTDVAREVGVEDVGAGMSVAWLDYDNDGREDLYVANMWTAAGIRVSEQDIFQKDADSTVRGLYQKHAMGNSLFRNTGDHFEDVSVLSGTTMGRWSWSSDTWDFNHDGFQDIYIANGMVTGTSPEDLNSFFWRQVVANSPNQPRPSHAYEQGWNAINELIRSDRTWSGLERNVFYLNNRNGTFSDISGILGLDLVEDSRTFALGDFDRDGRLEVVLKNRNGPQLRFLKNVLPELAPAISFRLAGKKSNRDAIGARITVQTNLGRQTRILRAGSGFLAQHTKELFFGLGSLTGPVQATIEWPSGLVQKLGDLPFNRRIWVEEGLPPSRIEVFAKVPAVEAAVPAHAGEVLPEQVETWLLVPVLAPDFSLPDLSGQLQTLSGHQGKSVLLHFRFAKFDGSEQELEEFERVQAAWSRKRLQLLTVNVDPDLPPVQEKAEIPIGNHSFPILKSSAEIIAIYNLLYRQMFDRHRDMSLPISFLIDPEGNIVKVYQGQLIKDHVEADLQSLPKDDRERLGKALPFEALQGSYEFGRNYLSFGFVFFERGYFGQSEVFFRKALQDDPNSAEALYGLGSAYLQQQKTKEARGCFERVMQLHASYPGTIPNAWNNLGILAAREGNTDLAIQYFQRALEIDPEHSIALQNLGSAYRQKKDWVQAKNALDRALALNPDDPEANYSLGMVYAQQNDTERAYQYLQKALVARPAYPEALNNLGILYLRTQRTTQAKQSFEQSIRVAPDYDQAYLNLARVYAIEGDQEKAKTVLLELLKQHPDHLQAKAELSQLER